MKSPHAEPDERGDTRSRPSPADKAVAKEPSKAAKPASASEKSLGKTADKAADKAVAKAVAKAPEKSPEKPVEKPTEKADSRYVVQFGAFADANAARTTRMKVERLGIKTYAQQVDTPGGKRIRVRIGPYVDRGEADKALATLRKAGLTGAVLTL
jgi:DedD protein